MAEAGKYNVLPLDYRFMERADPTMRPSLIYNVVLVLGLILVVMFPQITVWLPHLIGLH